MDKETGVGRLPEDDTDLAGDEPFDREYSYPELIPVSFFHDLHRRLKGLGTEHVFVVLRNGALHFSSVPEKKTLSLPETISFNAITRVDERTLAVPLTHELETHGFLVLVFSEECGLSVQMKSSMGRLIGGMVDQVVLSNYKTLLSSGLHSQVVKDTYSEIRRKSDLLEKSERKYRLLAESLEKEVLRKTKEVKDAQTHVMHQEKLASIGHLAAGVAHEINNPMGFISSNLRTLKEYCFDIQIIFRSLSGVISGVKDHEKSGIKVETVIDGLGEIASDIERFDIDYILKDIPQLLDESLDGAERINKIVSDLKDFAHPGEEEPTSADLIQCIESTLNIVWNELKYKTTVIRAYEAIPRINCYPRQLNQVIMNLLINSAQAIEKKGEIKIGTHDLGNMVELTIRDNGHGIPHEILPRIFDPFFTTKDVGKGTGLGLNLVYNIVKKHKGFIEVQSEPGKGTVFSVKIPVDAQLD